MNNAIMFYRTLILLVLLTSAGCGGERQNDSPQITNASLQRAVSSVAEQHILKAVDQFDADAQALVAAANAFCAVPDLPTLEAAQLQWRQLERQWFRLAPYIFGPLDDDLIFSKYLYVDSLRFNGVQYLASVREDIDSDLVSAEMLDADFFEAKSWTLRGLLMLEVLLFETAADEIPDTAAVLAEFQGSPRKCALLSGHAQALSVVTDYVVDGWREQFRNSVEPYLTLFLEDRLPDGTPNLTQLVSSVQDHLDYLKRRNVATVASPLAGESWAAIEASLEGIEQMLQGPPDDGFSLFALMRSNGFAMTVELIEHNFEVARQYTQSQDASNLAIALGTLDGNFKREIPDSLEVRLGLNFSDGD